MLSLATLARPQCSAAATLPATSWSRDQLAAEAAPFGIVPAVGARARIITYHYTTGSGIREAGSGLAVLPDGPVRGVVLYLPGSNFLRAAAPSQPGAIDGLTEAAVFAGAGFAVLLPDYPGLGSTLRPQAFTLVDDNLAATGALLAAARQEPGLAPLARPGLPLFVMGFSQGGQLAVALHRRLEQRPLAGFDHRASVAVAPPLDLAGMLQRRLHGTDAMGRALLAGAVWAHSVAAGVPVEDVFAPGVARRINWWLDGSHDAMAIIPELPETLDGLLTPTIRDAMANDPGHWLNRSLARATAATIDFVPRRPLRLVLGGADSIVEPAAALPFVERTQCEGGAVTVETVPGADHAGALAAAYRPALDWFTALAAAHARTATP